MSWVDEQIKEENDYCGITDWHNKGYKGKGVVVWNCEDLTPNHGEITERRIYDSAPECTVITAGAILVSSNKGMETHTVEYNGKVYDIEDFIREKNVKILTKSIGGALSIGSAESAYWNELKKKYNLIFFNSAGNEGTKDIGGAFPADVATYVGACTLVKGKPKRANYSSVGEELDFMAFVGVWSGTSFASPYLAGMCALICSVYNDITQEEAYEYFMKYAQDMQDEGKDDYTGYGLAKMGNIADLGADLGKDIVSEKIYLPIGGYTATKEIIHSNGRIDREEIQLDQPAVIDKTTNRTLAPVRAVAEMLGCEVGWDNPTRSVIIIK